jgi:hypothetical protein
MVCDAQKKKHHLKEGDSDVTSQQVTRGYVEQYALYLILFSE